MKLLSVSWELLLADLGTPYPTWTVAAPTLLIRSENVHMGMQMRDRRANEYSVLKRWRGGCTGSNKWWRCLLARILKSKLDRHQKIKLKIKFHLYISDSWQQNIQNIVTWGLKSQKFKVGFTCISMGPLIGGVRPSRSTMELPFFTIIMSFRVWKDLKCPWTDEFYHQTSIFDQIIFKKFKIVVQSTRKIDLGQVSRELVYFIPCLSYERHFVLNHDKIRIVGISWC